MRLGFWAMSGAALLLGSAVATARPGTSDDKAAAIAGRQAAFLMSAALVNGMKGAIERGADVKTQAFAARSLAGWAKALPGMFPAGTLSETSEALPTIWSDRAGFEAKAAAYAAAATKLAELAKAGDQAGFAAQFGVVGGTCGACHDVYRKPPVPKPG